MQIELTPDQAEKFKAIKWLTDPLGDKGTGRTQLLALAYIQHAMSYQCWIHVVNHDNINPGHPSAVRELMDRIISISSGIVGYSLKIRHHDRRILMEKKPPEYNKEDIMQLREGAWKDL